jgi:hypothetical protein
MYRSFEPTFRRCIYPSRSGFSKISLPRPPFVFLMPSNWNLGDSGCERRSCIMPRPRAWSWKCGRGGVVARDVWGQLGQQGAHRLDSLCWSAVDVNHEYPEFCTARWLDREVEEEELMVTTSLQLSPYARSPHTNSSILTIKISAQLTPRDTNLPINIFPPHEPSLYSFNGVNTIK